MSRFKKGDLAIFIKEPCEFEIVRISEVKTYASGGISYECEGYDSSFSESNLLYPSELLTLQQRIAEKYRLLNNLLFDAERLGVKIDFKSQQHILTIDQFRENEN